MFKWTKVTEDLPEAYTRVLVVTTYDFGNDDVTHDLLVATYDWHDERWCQSHGGQWLFGVTHWAPLPELPTE